MAITHTNIGGTIPTELGMLTGTKNMNLLDNNLEGHFPRELTNLRAMSKFVRPADALLFAKEPGSPRLFGAQQTLKSTRTTSLEQSRLEYASYH